jgi:hypothetical protein
MKNKVIQVNFTNKRNEMLHPKPKTWEQLQVLALKKLSRPPREFRYLGMTLQE